MNIALLGHGVVGKGVSYILGKLKDKYHLPIKKILVKDEIECIDSRMTLNINDILEDETIDIVVECMGGIEPAHQYVLEALKKGKHVVTSNKKMLATYAEELLSVASKQGVNLLYEASCGGGIPWMENIHRIKRIDQIHNLSGIFNGTTNYILWRMQEASLSLEEALEEAKKLGYAERDASDDLLGFDVRYKVALSIMEAFNVIVDMDSIPTIGIENIQKEDIAFALDRGYVCKLIGKAELNGHLSASVLPVFLKKNHFLAAIERNDNALNCESSYLGKASFVGQGAGSLPTAHAIVQNIMDILEGRKIYRTMQKKEILLENEKKQYYIRCAKKEALKEYIQEEINEMSFLSKEMKLEEIVRLNQEIEDKKRFIAEVEK